MHRTNASSDAESPRELPTSRPAARRITITVAAAGALSLAALAWSLNASHSPTADAVAPHATAAAASPDPLTGTASPNSPAKDRTREARTAATRTLTTWGASNPSAEKGHAVGGSPGTGPGGRITEVLRIPALGKDWAQPIYEGVTDRQLRAGVGHFPGTEQPGQIGNFALAGHRSGVSDPAFRNIDRITKGATITVTTAHRVTYTYSVARTLTVAPTDVDVIAQVPGQPTASPTAAKLTLVTCWPATGHSKRVVVEADLVSAKGGA
jgi:sortase A